jgi:hypothetical protein
MSDSAEVKILPPVVLVAAIGLEIGIAVIAPARVIPGPIAIGIGMAVIAVSVMLTVLAARQIVRADTAFDARKSTTAIVTTGVYRFTRNPVYLSMILLVGGIALLLKFAVGVVADVPDRDRALPDGDPARRTLSRTQIRRSLSVLLQRGSALAFAAPVDGGSRLRA